jgi:hypothetical protein
MNRKKSLFFIKNKKLIRLLTAPFYIFFLFALPASAAEPGRQFIVSLCGKCHGITLEEQCLTGNCANGKPHEIKPLAWDKIIPWMRALGCRMNDAEQKIIIDYLMGHFGKTYPLQWDHAGSVAGGWNIVSFGVFHNRLFAGIEGNGSIFRLKNGEASPDSTWEPVLNTPEYTVYGLVHFQKRLFAATNDPAAEIWSSADGEHWDLNSRLTEEKGVTSLGLFNGFLYAGTTRAGIYRSSNGTAWTRTGDLIPNAEKSFTHWVRFIIPFKGRLYAGIEKSGIFQTTDGVHWKPFWPDQESRLKEKASVGFRGASIFKEALYVGTTSSGEIWKIESPEKPPTRVFSVDLKKTGGYVGSMEVFENHLYSGIGGHVFRTNNGLDWEEVGHLGPYTIEAMKTFGTLLYAGTSLPPNGWIYRSTGKIAKQGNSQGNANGE